MMSSETVPVKTTEHWTESEKQIFKQEFMKYGADFEAIQQSLPNKTVELCEKFYKINKRSKMRLDRIEQKLKAPSKQQPSSKDRQIVKPEL